MANRKFKSVGRILRKLNEGDERGEFPGRLTGASGPRYVEVKLLRQVKFLRNLDEFSQHGPVKVIMCDGKVI